MKTLDLRTIVSILGPRPFPLPDSFKEYLTVVEVVASQQQTDEERAKLKSEGEQVVFEHKKEELETMVEIEEIEVRGDDSSKQDTKKDS